jgi:hypothetical protein
MGESFQDRDMAGTVFRGVNLGGAVFNYVNLGGAVFDDVNLRGATIHNVNLSNVSIDDANVKGMTIFGIRVDQLIEAELDRRDSERARLRMQDPHDPDSVREVMARLEQVRREFREMLRSTPAGVLVARPSPDQWSAVEIVRHLVFAEDLYLNRWIFRNDRPWNNLGLLPAFLASEPRYSGVGGEPSDDLEIVLEAWNDVHGGTQEFLSDLTSEKLRQDTSDVDFGQGTVGQVLQGMAQHDLHHIREAEAAIAKVGKE